MHNQYGTLSWDQPTTNIIVNRQQINQEPIRIELNIIRGKTSVDADTQTHRKFDILKEEFEKNPTTNEEKIRDLIDTLGMTREEIRRFYANERKERRISVKSKERPSQKEATRPQTVRCLTNSGDTIKEMGRRTSKRAQRVGASYESWMIQE